MFLYLSDVEVGGQTVFPKAKIPEGWEPNALPVLTDGACAQPCYCCSHSACVVVLLRWSVEAMAEDT